MGYTSGLKRWGEPGQPGQPGRLEADSYEEQELSTLSPYKSGLKRWGEHGQPGQPGQPAQPGQQGKPGQPGQQGQPGQAGRSALDSAEEQELFTLSPHKGELKRWWSWWSEPGQPGKPGRMAPDSDEGGLKMWGWSAQPGRPIYWMRSGPDWMRAGAKDWIRAGSTGWMRSAPSDMKRINIEPYIPNPMTRMATGDWIRLLTDDSSVPSEWINIKSDSYMLCRKSTR